MGNCEVCVGGQRRVFVLGIVEIETSPSTSDAILRVYLQDKITPTCLFSSVLCVYVAIAAFRRVFALLVICNLKPLGIEWVSWASQKKKSK
jgi:hypothetical protein